MLPALAGVALAVGLSTALPVTETGRLGVSPTTVAGLCLAGQLWYVAFALGGVDATGAPAGEPTDGSTARGDGPRLFGLANGVTLVRGALYATVAGLVVASPDANVAWIAAVGYGVGVLLDGLDGRVARTIGSETEIGKRLDMAYDTFGFVAAPLVAVVWGVLPVWYLSLSAARYAFRGAVGLRRARGRPVFDLPDSDLGKYLAGVQMVFLTAALVPAAPTALVRTAAPVVLTPSLAVFARDYLVVSGRVSRHAATLGDPE
ncbi:CDP-alcohol phosphatidyltransferase family protein [Halorubrum sp. BV1]|uniref:CDP-alcohol phosphatidyltransferase family protein n=1 Tax=Halorubrum sp. BV1 TaxID=1498500 RepID=UPI000678A176|nr:CDP-alcohol phosphatidyltransferase family protein [Halorubrum sp. BV1]